MGNWVVGLGYAVLVLLALGAIVFVSWALLAAATAVAAVGVFAWVNYTLGLFPQ